MIYVIFAVAAVAAGLISSHVRARKNLVRRLKEYFGKAPQKTDYDLGGIELYRVYKSANSDTSRCIDDITWDDLDMDEIFKRINVCLTSVGEEYLYNCLYEPQFERRRLEVRESFISRLEQEPEERFKIQARLAGLGKLNYNGLADLIYNSDKKLLKFPFIYNILSVIPFFCVGLMFVNASAGTMCLFASVIINVIVYMKTKRMIDASFKTIQYFSALIWCCGKLGKTGKTGEKDKTESMQSEPLIKKAGQLYKVFRPLMKRGTGLRQNSSDGETLLGIMYAYLDTFFLSGVRNYNKVISGILKRREQFHDLYKTLGEIDLSVCVLSFRESLSYWSKPELHEENSENSISVANCIKFEEIYHPLLRNPVANSGAIKNNSIITGSNASGKSTFIKALAVNGILAQTIFTCAAKEFSARYSLVMTSMALRDNISEGESYFITEIKSLKRIIDKIRDVSCVCYIDEILRGTNTIERIAASSAILNYLNGKDCLCVVASHDIELARMMQDRLDNYHFREKIAKDGGMIFDYKIKHGISNTRNAIKLLRYMDFDDAIIREAETVGRDALGAPQI